MLLFKNGIKQLFKDWLQFLIYVTLISIGVIFTSAFGIVSSNLVRTNNSISQNFKGYDYSYKFTSSSYESNDTQTLSPFFAFSNDNVGYSKNFFPTITIGSDDSVLKKFEFKNEMQGSKSTYNSSIYKYADASKNEYLLNFGFGDVEGYQKTETQGNFSYLPNDSESILKLSDEEKIKRFVKEKEFGRFYVFNENSKAFKSSLIGQLYEKNNNFEGNLNDKQKKTALDIFNYMFYVNNSSFTSSIKNFILNNTINKNLNDQSNWTTIVNNFVNYSGKDINYESEDDFKTKGYNGRIGNLFTSEDTQKYFIVDEDAGKINNKSTKLWDFSTIKNYGSYYLKNYDTEKLFKSANTNEGNYFIDKVATLKAKDLFNSYYDLLSDLTNFDITYTNEVVMWDTKGKYRFVSAFTDYQSEDNTKRNVKFNNEDLYTIYEENPNKKDDFLSKRSFITTYGYYKNNNLQLGSEYGIIPKDAIPATMSNKLRLDAIGVDALNTYPTIYDEDILTNQVNDAIFYVNSSLFSELFNEKDAGATSTVINSKFQDVSKAYLKHTSNPDDLEKDINLFKLFAADNLINLGDITNQINNYYETSTLENEFDYSSLSRLNPKSFNDTKVFNMRSGFFGQASKVFLLISFIFCLILLSVILFITYNLTKKFLNSQRGQIGNLKALGVRKTKIIINFILYLSLPIILMVPIGWGISIAIQKPLINIFSIYFNIPVNAIFDWKFLLVEWFIFAVLAISLIWFISFMTVKKNPLILMQPNKGSKPNIALTKLFNRFSFIKFTNKIRGSLIAMSFKDLFVFSFVIFISTTILTVSASIPNALSTMSNEYYSAINYNNDYTYTEIIANNPFTKYNWRSSNGNDKEFNDQNSLFSSYMKKDGRYLSLFDSKGWSSEDYGNFFESIIKHKALGLNGYLLSTGNMKQIVDTSTEVYKGSNTSNGPKRTVNQIACSIMPSLFDQPAIDNAEYDECIKSMTNNVIPSTIKQKWTDDNNAFLSFSFNFNVIPYNESEDEVYTNIKAIDSKYNNIKLYGLNKDSKIKNINLKNRDSLYYESDDENIINASINETLKLKGYDVGSKINLKFDVEELGYLNNENSIQVATDNFIWKYNNEEIDVNNLDLGHFAYNSSSNNSVDKLYYEENGEYKEYKDLSKLSLQIKDTSVLNQEVFKKVNGEYKDISGNDLDIATKKEFNPFDIRVYENGVAQDIGLEDLINGTNSWWNIALENGLIKNKLETREINIKVLNVEKVYDSPKIYMDQVRLNKVIGFKNFDSNKLFKNDSKINIWSNAKMSKNVEPVDVFNRAIVKFKNWNNTTTKASKYMTDAIGFTDYINLKKAATSNLITSVSSISIVFITISMIVGIIIIYVITDLFVGRYKSFMNYMRVQGYSLREINSIILWIFLPLTILFSVLAISTTMGLMLGLVPKMLLSIEIAIPLMISWYVYIIVFIVSVLIFSTAYVIIIRSLFRVKLASLTGVAN
ncbi:ABC transporter permease [Spiroplasma turonicum]|uniref:ABC3 transporter permease C-terminal domain-containing protein n=1 Tax=Spiroplasma turonicum TaxID=216946 RepID=A0A0K1P7I4_9MOLU|nr:ABC transporter permease [Spiroplasma turonicum]AKU80271.1 hypothetical protein STURON_001025 [Spiroplasma turonicum]ALX71272.1 ABC transporter permease [Spiroplasma turonicum]